LLVFVAAERRELEGLLVHVDEIANPHWPLDFARLGRLNGAPVVLVANGPGPKLAGEALDIVERNVSIDGIVSTGFCGGLKLSLGNGEIFVATEVIGSGSALMPGSSRPFKTGKLLSVDRVVSTAVEKYQLGETADAVEMEASAVAERAQKWKVHFYAVRVVTDTCKESFPMDFNQMRSADGRFSRGKILAAARRRPVKMVPQLIKLNKTTKRAAQALGDFLADARF
jgi:nucleoside phosphorylase